VSSSALHKIDLHTHILPEHWPDLRERYGYGGWVRLEHYKPCCARMMIDDHGFREIQSNCWHPNQRLIECDRDRVSVQVLSTVPVMFSYWARPGDALDLAMHLNDHIASVCRDFPHRFAGLGTVPMQMPRLAIQELRRCVGDLGLRGIEIGTNINGMNLDDPTFFPIFEAAADLGACVFIHPWEMMAQDRMPRYWLPWLVGMPAETALAVCSMIFGGVFERLPNLKVCFAHGGGAFPFTVGRIEHGFLARPDLCAADNDVNPREYLGEFWVDSLVHDAEALRYLIKVMGERRIVLGSDYPFPLGEEHPGALVESMTDLAAEVRGRLLVENALEFLGTTAEAFLPKSAVVAANGQATSAPAQAASPVSSSRP
jgi:aminocarboxymuconate-semialdehyde decarboxylase